ncbi:hypothetical protein KGF56_003211 [Candida oxycetoniae]|uniref:Uncharacterized protein n=1 Tax=Candida oxycetoniae TaxID=497107 RepID=A0AAI9WXF3_9ASCO|nr:uncharacterized protein KGF56_003211 [Candida oxycetoniae]KAI3403944.1 hypothetical protein KGF56_003211 [Candida oxycetoniae]
MPLHSFKQAILYSLELLFYFIIPTIAALYIIPKFITPDLVDKFQINFKVILLSRELCQVKPYDCEKLLDLNYGDPDLLQRRVFHYYDLIYVVNKHIAICDDLIVKMLLHDYNPFMFISKRMFLIERDDEGGVEFWGKFEESLRIIIALINITIFQSIRGIIVSKMWVFFLFGIVITVFEPWSRLAGPIWNILREANNVF